MLPTFDSRELGMSFHGASSVELNRLTQHIFKALTNAVKSVIFKPSSSLHFLIVAFLILALYFQMKLEIILLTSSVKDTGVSRTLRTKVSFERASVLTIFIFSSTEMSLDDQILSIK